MDNKIIFSLIFVLILGTLTNQSFATSASQTKVISSDLEVFDQLGHAVSISGDIMAVAAPEHDFVIDNSPAPPTIIEDAGAVYLFERNTGGPDNWGEVKIITASTPAAFDFFGTSVSLAGDRLVVGASGANDLIDNPDPTPDTILTDSGAAYVFDKDFGGADTWGERTILRASDPESNDQFGHSVSLSADSADVIVVGSLGADDLIDNPDPDPDTILNESGAAYVFERNLGGDDTWGERAILQASDTDDSHLFGFAVTAYGDTIVVGAIGADDLIDNPDPAPDTPIPNSGAAYVYDRDFGGADTWGERVKLTASDASSLDGYGISVALDGDTLAVGSLLRDADLVTRAGGVYIYERNFGGADMWGERTILTASDASSLDGFGISVALEGDTLVAGALGDDTTSEDTGSAYTFDRNFGGADTWGQTVRLEASDATSFDDFGRSVDVSGSTTVVGAPAADNLIDIPDPDPDVLLPDSGAAYVHEPVTVERDTFTDFHSTLELTSPGASVQELHVSGTFVQHVFFEGLNQGDASDNDGDTRDEVQTELVSMSLTGDSSLGVITIQESSTLTSLGEFEEQVDNNSGLLDVDPFATGNADAFFDVFFEIEIVGQTYHNEEPLRISGVIDNKPSLCDELLESTTTLGLFDEDGVLSGFAVGPSSFNECPPPSSIGDDVQSLMDDIDALVDSGDLNPRTASASNWLLGAALSAIDDDDSETAKSKLQSFISRITLFMNRGLIPVDIGQPLIDAAQVIIDNC